MEVVDVLGIKSCLTVGKVEVVLQPELLAITQGQDLTLVGVPCLAPSPQSNGIVWANVPSEQEVGITSITRPLPPNYRIGYDKGMWRYFHHIALRYLTPYTLTIANQG